MPTHMGVSAPQVPTQSSLGQPQPPPFLRQPSVVSQSLANALNTTHIQTPGLAYGNIHQGDGASVRTGYNAAAVPISEMSRLPLAEYSHQPLPMPMTAYPGAAPQLSNGQVAPASPVEPTDPLANYRAALASHHARHATSEQGS